MTYLQVKLERRRALAYQPPRGHDVAWVAVAEGALRRRQRESTRARSRSSSHRKTAIDFVAEGDTRFVLGSAAPHPHELVLGNYSVHTSAEALQRGEAEIRRIGRELRDNGTLRYARPAVTL